MKKIKYLTLRGRLLRLKLAKNIKVLNSRRELRRCEGELAKNIKVLNSRRELRRCESALGLKLAMIYEEYTQICSEYYKKYGKEHTLVLIEVGSFWELYNCNENKGADMKRIGELLNIQVSKKNKNIPEITAANPEMAGFPSHSLEKFLPVLLQNNYNVVLVSQVTPPPNPERRVTHVYSKGTYLSDSSTTDNTIMSLYIEKCSKKHILGMATVNLSTGKSEFQEIQHPFDELYKLITTPPAEIIIFGNDTPFLKKFLHNQNVIEFHDQNMFSSLSFQNHILEKVFDNPTMLSIIEYLGLERHSHATQAYAFLMQYILDHNPSILKRISKPEHQSSKSPILEISFNNNDQLDIQGLEKILNKCQTAIGRRYFKHRLFNPYTDSNLIAQSLNDIENNPYPKDYLSDVFDIEKIYRRFEMERANISTDVINLYTSLKVLDTPDAKPPTRLIESYFHFNNTNNNPFQKSISKTLIDLCENLEDLYQKRKNLLNKLNGNHDYFKLERNDRDGYYLSITKKRYTEIKPNNTDFYKVTHATNSVKLQSKQLDFFTTTEEMTNKAIQTEIDKVFSEFTLKLLEHGDSIKKCIKHIALTDFNITCAQNAIKYKYSKPKIGTKLTIKDIRHPIIERILDTTSYVSNDIEFDQNGMLLYGLNASGKSSLMKAVGLCIVMAQAGMFVPASEMQIDPFEQLFCRIQKGDNLYAGQSTFMVEMMELRNILKRATSKSFIIGDELCAGTESLSAISIVASGIVSLSKIKASFIFATHLHELVELDIVKSIPNLQIFHLDVFYDKPSDALVYNRTLAQGSGSKIYGLEVCKSFDMDKEFLEVAYNIRSVLQGTKIKKSRYNSKCFMDVCAVCKEKGTDMHHIKEQHTADKNGFINHMHKNHKSNLICLCKKCHDAVHAGKLDIGEVKMTSRGRAEAQGRPRDGETP